MLPDISLLHEYPPLASWQITQSVIKTTSGLTETCCNDKYESET